MMMALLALIASATFAQRVGDTVQYAGSNYTVTAINGDDVTMRKVVAQGDGPINWVAVPDSSFGTSNNNIRSVAWGNNTWVAVGQYGKIAYSSDGRSWTAVTPGTNSGQSGFPASGNSSGIDGVAFGNNTFVAVGVFGRMASSPDGRTWTAVTSSISGTNFNIAFGGGRWFTGSSALSRGTMGYSTDGRTWTAVDVTGVFGASANGSYGFAYGNNRWVAVGSNGKIAYSSNGTSWTAANVANTGFSTNANAVAYGNNRFVAVSGGGRIAYSTDGASWTAVANSTVWNYTGSGRTLSAAINSIAFGNNRFVAVGAQGKIAYSTDGATWTAVANTTFTGDINAIAYGNGRFVAVGESGRMAYCDW